MEEKFTFYEVKSKGFLEEVSAFSNDPESIYFEEAYYLRLAFKDSENKLELSMETEDTLILDEKDIDELISFLQRFKHRIKENKKDKINKENKFSSGDFISIGDFIEDCKHACFIDYDGFGYLCKDGLKTEERIIPSDIRFKYKFPYIELFEYDGVLWYNR